ncbi:MAG: peptide deformylase [Clostridium sp.]|uniref:peptide deformylase n=1 Tax=Clostridium sp. TaxID=1506 RepID=UPI003EE67DAA
MAIRNIRKNGDDVLRKKSKFVDKVDNRTLLLIEDMIDTMYEADGVGLAAPQVGILKRIFVVDICDDFGPRIFINPEILEVKGSQIGEEGCLSTPGEFGDVDRPNYVKIKALNENNEEFVLEATEFLARAICHEYDHLEGTLFLDKVL